MVTFDEADKIINKRLFLVTHPLSNNVLMGDNGKIWYDITDKDKDYVEMIIDCFYTGVDLKIDAGWIRLTDDDYLDCVNEMKLVEE